MRGEYINPQKVDEVAGVIHDKNQKLLDEFVSVKNASDKLRQVWVSPSASKVMPIFEDLRIKYVHRRYETIEAYVSYLKNVVGTGYVKAESDNTSLADKFK